MGSDSEYDVVVVGAGNAALCAALSARELGGRVLVLEKASEEERGGNSTFTAGAAVQIFDSKTIAMVRDEYRIKQVTKAEARTLEELAEALDINPQGLLRTVTAYNAACQPGDYNPAILDGKRTEGIAPPKSNWALPINEPPYYGFVVTCGITFTFGGLRINTEGEVQDTTDTTIPGLYAAGELVGGIFYQNYLGGAGLMSGSVFGRLAGRSAGQYAIRHARVAAE